jgi:hypothetical protein
VVEAPRPPTELLLLPDAQATNRAELVEKRATKVSLAYFTVSHTTLVPSSHTTATCPILDDSGSMTQDPSAGAVRHALPGGSRAGGRGEGLL